MLHGIPTGNAGMERGRGETQKFEWNGGRGGEHTKMEWLWRDVEVKMELVGMGLHFCGASLFLFP